MNLIKGNEVASNLFNDLKVTYCNNILEIINYTKLLSFDDSSIVLSKLSVEGENLRIVFIDKYLIRVNGKITLIKGE